MPEQEHEYDDFEEGMADELDEDGDEDEEGGDDEPTAVFVSITPGKEGADEAARVIAGVCERLELEAQRMPAKGGTEALYELVESSDFAIIDVSNKRPGLAEELEVTSHELDRAFTVFIAKTGSPKPPELEGRTIQFYADKGDLRALIERSLNSMIDAWHEGGEGEGDDEDDEEV